MFRKFFERMKEFAAPLLSEKSRQQFLVTSISAALTLVALIVFWNLYILPHQVPVNNSKILSSGPQASLADGGSGRPGDADAGDKAEKEAGKEQDGGNPQASVKEESPVEETRPSEDALPEPDISQLQLPLKGKLMRKYGFTFCPAFNDYRFNGGIDVAAAEGNPVKCALAGVVEQIVPDEGSSGSVITVDHGGGWKTVYSNVGSLQVRKGSGVSSGAILGYLGTATSGSDNALLHLELLFNGEKVDPLKYFDY